MKNTKKVLSVALAGALAFGSMGAAFAAAPVMGEDTDKKVVEAVERLSAFGIVNGMEDGKYHEEMKVTREQFAKILVEALGLGNAATAAKGATKFADVEASRWSTGYINVAQGQGLLTGYPDGTFKPSKEVSYAEAVTMLVRALGYKDEFLAGSWPGNYVAKAADVDITDGVKFGSSEGTADRGAVAVMVNNTLDAKVIKQESFGDDNNWSEDDATLLEDKLDIEKLEKKVITATPAVEDSIDKDQLEVDDKAYDVESEEVKAKMDTLLGESMNVYLNDDDEIVFVEKSDENFKTVYGLVDSGSDAVKDSGDDDEDVTLLFSDGEDKDYKLDKNVDYYIDNKSADFADFVKESKTGKLFVKAILNDNGNVSMIQGQKFDKEALIVKEADEKEITYMIDDSDDDKKIKAKDYDKVVVTDEKGNLLTMKDIKKDDVIYVNDKNGSDDLEEAASELEVAYITVVRNVVEGEAKTWSDDEFEIAGKDYDVSSEATVSVNSDEDLYDYVSADGEDKLNDMTDADAKVVALKDIEGKIRHIRTDVEASSDDKYAVVVGIDERYKDYTVKVLTTEGKKVEFDLDFDEDDFEGYSKESDIKEGDVVKYTVNKDGEIDSMIRAAKLDGKKVVAVTDSTSDDDFEVKSGTLSDDFDKDSMEVSNKSYVVKDDVVVFDYNEAKASDGTYDPDDVETLDWAKLEDKGDGSDVIYVLDDRDTVQFMVVLSDIQSDDEMTGYVVKRAKRDGDVILDVMMPGKDEKVRYTVDKGDAEKERIIVFTENSDGDIKIVDADASDDFEFVTGKVEKVRGKYIDVDGSSYKVASDAVYYETDDVVDFSDIDEDEYVTFVVKNAYVQAVKLYDVDKDAKASDDEVEALVEAAEEHNNKKYEWKNGELVVKGDADTKAPEITTDLKDQTVNKAELKFTASAKDDVDGDVDVKVTLDGKEVTGDTLTLEEGDNTVKVTAEDKAGNKEEKTFTIKYSKDAVVTPSVKEFKAVTSLEIGKKLVMVELDTDTPEKYEVTVKDVKLDYNTKAKKFIGDVADADAKEENVKVTAK